MGTPVARGGLPWRHAPDGTVALSFPPKGTRGFADRAYVLEHGITTDFALVRAWRGYRHGNLVLRRSAANLHPPRRHGR